MRKTIWGLGLAMVAAFAAVGQTASAQSFLDGRFDPAIPTLLHADAYVTMSPQSGMRSTDHFKLADTQTMSNFRAISRLLKRTLHCIN